MLKKLWPYAKPYGPMIVGGIACSAMEAVFELLIPLIMADIVDIGIAGNDLAFILKRGGWMVLMAICSLAFGVGAAALAARAGHGFGSGLRKAEYEKIQNYSFANIEKFSTASLVTRLTNDITNMQMTLNMCMRIVVRAPVMLISALILSITISAQLSSVFLAVLPLLTILVFIVIRRTAPLFRSLQEKTDALNLTVQENLTGIRVVKSFVKEEKEKEKFEARNQDLKMTSYRAFGMVVITMPVMMLIIYGTIIAVMWFGGHMVHAGTMETGKLMTFFTYIMQIMMSLMMVSMVFMMLTRSIACARRILEVLEEVPSIQEKEEPLTEVKDGSIAFKNVFFRYNLENPEWVLNDISCELPSGATVGVLGGTGSGKTSLVSLIPRLYDAQEGVVEIGGRSVKEYSLETLRDSVSMVLQKNTLFSGSIRENLRWGNPEATDEQLWEALEAASAADFVRAMPKELDADLGQGGVNVSGGQKQRLCIARAILKQPKVLILDDSTSAVDTATDAKIQAAFKNLMPNTTKIIIAQRITSVKQADFILLLDEGKLIAKGSHEELMASSDIYREIYESQQEGVDEHGGT